MKLRFFAIAVAAVACAGAAHASTTVGDSSEVNCYPFSCFAGDGGVLYQQLYDASAFPGAIDVGSVTFFRADDGLMDSASYDIAFYLSDRPLDGMSETPGDNLGFLLADWGNFSLSGLMPAELTFDGVDFTYDPADGNLLMQVTVTAVGATVGYDSFFQADSSISVTQRLYDNAGGVEANDALGLVTRFNDAVPEPASWALMILGFGGVGSVIRRRRETLAATTSAACSS
jgi:hypothetical protein